MHTKMTYNPYSSKHIHNLSNKHILFDMLILLISEYTSQKLNIQHSSPLARLSLLIGICIGISLYELCWFARHLSHLIMTSLYCHDVTIIIVTKYNCQ